MHETEIQATGATNKRALTLVDDRFSADAPIAPLHRLCWVGVWNALPSDAAYWHPDETEALDRVDRDLVTLAGQLGHGWAVYVIRICTRGLREFYFYAGDGAHFETLATDLGQMHPNYRVEYEERADPQWDWYRRHLRGAA